MKASMNEEHLRLYLWEIEEQCRYALKAWTLIQSPQTDPDTEPWYSIQAFLVATANISKFLWPNPRKKARGEQLRDFLSVQDGSPLKWRKVRDSFEHFDERLDSWIAPGKGDHFGRVYGPSDLLDFEPEDNARIYDPRSGHIALFGEEYDIREAVKEVERLHSILREEPESLRHSLSRSYKPKD